MADPRNHRMPPVGVNLTTDVERRVDGFRARVRWTDPSTKKRVGRVTHVRSTEGVEEFFDQMRTATQTGANTTVTLAEYAASIGDRWKRGLDPTSTAENYDIGLRLRVLPALGHIQLVKLTAGMIDRTIDTWETQHSASTIKNSIAPLVRVLDEAVRDDVITINPAKHRARRNLGKQVTQTTGALRQYAIPDLATLRTLADACGKVHQSYSDHVMLAALLAARGSEVAGLRAGDVDWTNRVVRIERQHYPGKGGLVVKQTKGRRARLVPILDALEPVLERLTAEKEPDVPLLRGPRGGVLTTATVRDATHWDDLVKDIGLPNLTRHGLRHTGATWLADAGIPLHVLQEILGHQSIETTKGYLHPDHRHLAEAAKQANQFLSATPARREAPRRDAPRL
ncbi:tyrosine-type recombinase/integrase [Propionibacterium freudenreichii]|uniref:tyrosine-type recombinase/integrase n=1 Tax=Propionibacterium freudenreichii TaxID=1744 RepID=UPI000BC35259|nr:site-specific integrase [Propionibacterium freudenreichii]SCQ58492.1 Prophage integrase [Propionibacterium freudenreichii]